MPQSRRCPPKALQTPSRSGACNGLQHFPVWRQRLPQATVFKVILRACWQIVVVTEQG